jgi:hypothetical protein
MVFFPVLYPGTGGADALVTDLPLRAASTEMIVNATTAQMTNDVKASAKLRAGRVKVFMVIGVSSDFDSSNTLEERPCSANLRVRSPTVREGSVVTADQNGQDLQDLHEEEGFGLIFLHVNHVNPVPTASIRCPPDGRASDTVSVERLKEPEI